MSAKFSIARLPRIEFGAGAIATLPSLVARYGRSALLVSGAVTLQRSPVWPPVEAALGESGIDLLRESISGEPAPQTVDEIARRYRGQDIDVVVGIGGGSVLDAAKAVAGLLRIDNSVMDFLEGVGPELPYRGPATPLVAVPTTAGTGSEATKNAVLSIAGKAGFKKSFRDEQLVPAYALVDPDLLATCPRALIAADGMDALTQLMESFVSIRSNPMTDALAWSGMQAVRDALLPWYEGNGDQPSARSAMAYAALQSGICLAQTGLGSVHGLASPLGAFFPIPHGVVCGTLVGAATRTNIDAMLAREADNPALGKYASIAELLLQRKFPTAEQAWSELVALLDEWTERMELPTLDRYGVTGNDFAQIVAHSRGSSMKTNPIVLSDDEITTILQRRCSA